MKTEDIDVLIESVSLKWNVAMKRATLSFQKLGEALNKRPFFKWKPSPAYVRSLRNSPRPHGFLKLSRGRGMSSQNRKANKHGRIGADRRVHR